MHRLALIDDGLELQVVGPLPLQSSDPKALLWLVKAGSVVLGSVRLAVEHGHVAELRDLQLLGSDSRSKQVHSGKLMCAIAEYAREHGLLKLTVHDNSRVEWLPQQLSRLGFSDAARGDEDMQFYLDLYHRPTRKRDRSVPPRSEYSMAC